MAVLSVLNCISRGSYGTVMKSNHLGIFSAIAKKNIFIDHARHMASHRTMVIKPSRFQWKKFNDSLHFFTMLGVIPLSILIFCVNVFIGPAELAEIPEGYEPKEWEYYKHPISRFFARYIYPTEQQTYEKMLHYLNEEQEKREQRFLERKVRQLMSERLDYKAWYYVPSSEGKYTRRARKERDDFWVMHGKQ